MSWNLKRHCNIQYCCRHAPRERVSWNRKDRRRLICVCRHAPRERVSWNRLSKSGDELQFVTLHVSVWVEIVGWQNHHQKHIVTLHVSVWVEIWDSSQAIRTFMSRSTWACELKFCTLSVISVDISHAPRERVSWNCLPFAYTTHLTGHAPRERVSWNLALLSLQYSAKSHAPRERMSWNDKYFRINKAAWLRSGGIFIPKYYTFFMCFPSNPPIHTPKFVQTNDL